MVLRWLASVRKETLILLRDKAGLVILFLMPVALIVIMSLLQEVGFKSIHRDIGVDMLILDKDNDTLGKRITRGLTGTGFFRLADSLDGQSLTKEKMIRAVQSGDFLIGVLIPEGLTAKIRKNVQLRVTRTMAGFRLPGFGATEPAKISAADTITIYFDPTVKKAFKTTVTSTIRQFNYQIESELVFQTFNQEMAKMFPMYQPPQTEIRSQVEFREVFPTYHASEILPDTAQHNVPAWAVFAMFFIVIPLSSGMIAEREAGSMFRLLTMPVPYAMILMAKISVYLVVCFLQTMLMILAGIWLLPFFGSAALNMDVNFTALITITLASSLAALGFGVMTGTIARTQQQAAAFGSVSIIILAALGGLWVPVYLMAPSMQKVASLSPLNWALNGYYDIFVRGAGMQEILPETIRLLLFFASVLLVTILFWKMFNPMKN